MKYTIVNDDDGHSYLIPADQVSHWYDVWYHSEDYEDGIVPEYAQEVTGRTLVFEHVWDREGEQLV